MTFVGLDDTDAVGTRGTNQLARAIVRRLGQRGDRSVICRHQLLHDLRIPCTSKNGSASIQLPLLSHADIPRLIGEVRAVMRAWFVPGSDPGLCVAADVPDDVRAFGQLCQQQIVTRHDAHSIARSAGLHLEGLGGTELGVVGALAAVGLVASGDSGRVVQLAAWPYPDDFGGVQPAAAIRERGVDSVECRTTGSAVTDGLVEVGKHLRPNLRGGRIVLFVEPTDDPHAPWRAIKL